MKPTLRVPATTTQGLTNITVKPMARMSSHNTRQASAGVKPIG